MRELLFLCHRIPYPPDKGDKIRAFHMLRHLARSYHIHLGCLADDPDDLAHVPALRGMCAEVVCMGLPRRLGRLAAVARTRWGAPLSLGYFENAALRRWTEARLARPGLRVLAFCSAMAPYVMARAPSAVLDMVDVDSEKFAAYAANADWPARLLWQREARTLLAFERRAARRFARTLFVSDAERERFAALAPESAERTATLENGVDLARFHPGLDLPSPFPAGEPVVVFTGTMNYRPNIDAAVWFARSALPLLRASVPSVGFHVVGAEPAAEVRALAALPGVRVSGRVPDTRPYLAHAAAVVAPLAIARGVQNKVLEAMAMGRPAVVTPAAFEGLRATPGVEILIAKGAEETAARLAEILRGEHPGLGAAARRGVETRYDWTRTLAPLDALLEEAAP